MSRWAANQKLWPPPTTKTVSEWAEKTIRLPSTEAEAGPFRLQRTPYLREPLDAFADPDVEQITLMCSTQVGKTTFELICMCYAFDQAPGRGIWVMPREEDAEYMLQGRLKPIIEQSPDLSRHVSGRKEDWTKKRIHLHGMDLYLAWAGSEAAVQSKPCAYIAMDELSVWEYRSGAPDPVDN